MPSYAGQEDFDKNSPRKLHDDYVIQDGHCPSSRHSI